MRESTRTLPVRATNLCVERTAPQVHHLRLTVAERSLVANSDVVVSPSTSVKIILLIDSSGVGGCAWWPARGNPLSCWSRVKDLHCVLLSHPRVSLFIPRHCSPHTPTLAQVHDGPR
jgi:hypothetical protein